MAPPLFAGRYELLEKLGQGGMGVVYKARDTRLGRVVALKGMSALSEADLRRFEREARMAAQLAHPHIVRIHDVEIAGDQTYLTMDYIEGRSLRAAGLDRRVAVEAAIQVADALHYAHERGIIHRDVKPDNILLDGKNRAYLADFGLARPVASAQITVSGTIVGTPAYMSPEQARGLPASERSDVYSLGATLYEALTGSPPFPGTDVITTLAAVCSLEPKPPRAFDPKIHADLETIVLKCLEKEPARRYASAADVARDLRAWLAGEPISARPPSAFYRLKRRLLKRKAVLVTGAVALLAGIGVVAAVLVPAYRRKQRELEIRRELKPLEDAVRDARPYLYIRGIENLREKEARVREALARLEERPDNPPEVWTSIGMGWHFLGELAKAEAALLRADPRDPDTNFALARVYFEVSLLQLVTGHPDTEARRAKARETSRKALDRLARLPAGWGNGLERRLASAYRLYSEGDYGETSRACREAIAEFGDRVGTEEFWYLIGASEGGPGQIDALTKALERRPHYAWASFLRSTARERGGDLEGAIADVRETIDLVPGYAEAHNNLGLLRWGQGDLERALASFDEAVRLDPRLAAALANRADVRRLRGDLAGAETDALGALGLLPDFPQALAALGTVRFERNEIDSASELAERALAIHPGHPAARYLRAGIRRRKKDWAGAIDDFDAALRGVPPYRRSLILVERAQVRGESGDVAGQIRDLEEALETGPKSARLYNDLGGARVNAGDWDGAVVALNRALDLQPRYAMALRNRGNARRGQGRFLDAVRDFDAAIEIEPGIAKTWADRGAAKRSLRDVEGALRDYEQAIALDRNCAIAYYGRGLVHMERQTWDDAVREFSEAIRCDPNYAEAYVNRGTASGHLGDRVAHIADFERALEIAPRNWPHRAQVEAALKVLRP